MVVDDWRLTPAGGTPAFFEGPTGVQRLPPLAQRFATDFAGDPRFDNPRAVQVRVMTFDHAVMVSLGINVRDLYADGTDAADRIPPWSTIRTCNCWRRRSGDRSTGRLASRRAGVLRKLVADVLDRVDQVPDHDPLAATTARPCPRRSSPRRERSAATLSPQQVTRADHAQLDLP